MGWASRGRCLGKSARDPTTGFVTAHLCSLLSFSWRFFFSSRAFFAPFSPPAPSQHSQCQPTSGRQVTCVRNLHTCSLFSFLSSRTGWYCAVPPSTRDCADYFVRTPPLYPHRPFPPPKKKVTVGFVCGDGGRQATHSETFLEEAALFFL